MNAENHVSELIPGYVLGCLDPDELAQVEAHLPGCRVCQEELDSYQAVADELPLAVPMTMPPADLKRRLMDSVAGPQSGPAKAAGPAEPELSWWQRIERALQGLLARPLWQPLALLLILALALGNLLLLRQVIELSRAEPGTILLSGTEAAPQATGVIVLNQDASRGTLVAEGLPPLDPAQQYQLWLIDDGQRLSGGVFSVDDDGFGTLQLSGPQSLADYAAFGITVEPAGGSPGPTGTRVLGSGL
jgi:anti-sigma-K factor RskA